MSEFRSTLAVRAAQATRPIQQRIGQPPKATTVVLGGKTLVITLNTALTSPRLSRDNTARSSQLTQAK